MSGQDTNRDGVLQSSETTQSRYVCDGISQPDLGPVLVRLTEDGGDQCLHAGTISSVGNDTNANGLLDDNEVTSSSYICRDNTAPYLSVSGAYEKDSQNRTLAYSGVGVEANWNLGSYDSEDDPVEMTLDGIPDWLTYDELTRELKGTPGSGDKGPFEINIVLTLSLIHISEPTRPY